ncbi:hypothetical protein BDQ17DRAFT_1421026 [Cyathus striatus]|nr:hypothetical protein BDQ17DRAFT_1421026 [Cyathus striatus]
MALSFLSVLATLFALFVCILAEKHTVTFENNCGFGTPRLIQGPKTLSTGDVFTSDGPLTSAISYLQTGDCGFDGIGCSLVELTLINPTCPGCGSSTDISLIPPLAFSVPVDFAYYGGCDGLGATCSTANCKTAFFVPDDNQVQVACQDNDVNLKITFCPNTTSSTAVHPEVTTTATVAKTSSSAKPVATAPSKAKVCNARRAERLSRRTPHKAKRRPH